MGNTVRSLGNKTEETSSSDSPSWAEVLLLGKVSVEFRNLQALFHRLRDFITLNSITILLSCKTHLVISKDTGEYNSFCRWDYTLLDRNILLFISQFCLIQLSVSVLLQGHVCESSHSTGLWCLPRKEKFFPFPRDIQLKFCCAEAAPAQLMSRSCLLFLAIWV